MAIQYTWKIRYLESIPSENGLTNIVKNIHWTYQASTGNTVVETTGTLEVGAPDPSTYVPYENLTQTIIEGWLDSTVDKVYLKMYLDPALNKILTNDLVILSTPF